MSGAQHTQGPWRLGARQLYGAIVSINAAGWSQLATCVVKRYGAREDLAEGVANANLIVAAPDLLAAAKQLIAGADDTRHTDAVGSVRQLVSVEAVDALRAAVAKAEARS